MKINSKAPWYQTSDFDLAHTPTSGKVQDPRFLREYPREPTPEPTCKGCDYLTLANGCRHPQAFKTAAGQASQAGPRYLGHRTETTPAPNWCPLLKARAIKFPTIYHCEGCGIVYPQAPSEPPIIPHICRSCGSELKLVR